MKPSRHSIFHLACLTVFLVAGFSSYGAAPQVGRSKVLLRKNFLFSQPNASAPATLVSAALQGLDAQLIDDYASFTYASIKTSDLQRLDQQTRTAKVEAISVDEFDIVQLPKGRVDARLGAAASNPGKTLRGWYADGELGLYVVQFRGPIRKEWVDDLAVAGITAIQYVPYNAYIVSAQRQSMVALGGMSAVQFVDVFHPSFKSNMISMSDEARTYVVEFADIKRNEAAVKEVTALAREVIEVAVIEETTRITGLFDGKVAQSLVNRPLVIGVYDVPTLRPSDERVAMGLTGNVSAGGLPVNPGHYKKWLKNICSFCDTLAIDGFNVAVADLQGLDGGKPPQPFRHPDLPVERVEYGADLAEEATDPPMRDLKGHATAVIGVIAGDPATDQLRDPTGFFYGTGIAPSTKIVITALDFPQNTHPQEVTSIDLLVDDAKDHDAHIQNHSHNQYTVDAEVAGVCTTQMDGWYSLLSRDFDRNVRDSSITLTVSSGNEDQQVPNATVNCPHINPWYTLPPGTSKNALSMGGAENVRDASEQFNCRGARADSYRNLMFNGKRGTQLSGWFKPDLFAPASNITSQRSQGSGIAILGLCTASPLSDWFSYDTTYIASTGTSFAAPAGAAAAVLASRVYSEHVRGSNAPDPAAATPALIKAMLIGGAKSMRGGIDRTNGTTIGPLPNSQQGFGRLSLDEVLNPYPARVYINQGPALSSTGSPQQYFFKVHDPALPVKVVLVWTDQPALTNLVNYSSDRTATPLINNLNLSVTIGSPCSDRYVGNSLEVADEALGETSSHQGCTGVLSYDGLNNVELVKFYAAADSAFSVLVEKVSGGSSTQDFALFVHNAYENGATVVVPRNLTATVTSPSTVNLGWQSGISSPSYDVWRSSAGAPFSPIGSSLSTTFADSNATNGVVHLYRVRANNGGFVSGFSNVDSALPGSFSDQPVLGGVTAIKASHLTELRQAVQTFRSGVGLEAFTFTDPLLDGLFVKAIHFAELRVAINQARALLALPQVVFADEPLSSGTLIKAAHIQQLRDAIR